MKRDDSLSIVAMILNSFPNQAGWTEEQMDTYAKSIQDLDAENATKAVARAVKEMKYRPSVSELREYAWIEKNLAKPYVRADDPSQGQDMPDWAAAKFLALSEGDNRVFPQQKAGYDQLQEGNPRSRTYVWGEQEAMPKDRMEALLARVAGLSHAERKVLLHSVTSGA